MCYGTDEGGEGVKPNLIRYQLDIVHPPPTASVFFTTTQQMNYKSIGRTLFLELRHKGRCGRYTLNWVPVAGSEGTTSPEDGNVHFTSREALHMANSRVFKGTLVIGDETYPKQVVCKLVSGNASRTRKEAEFYMKHLKDVQDILVPKFIGLFSGICQYTEEDVRCILLEYAGKALEDNWTDISMATRAKVIDKLLQLHRIGIYHGDFRPENVVIDETGNPRMIDFEGAVMHECLVTKWDITVYETQPLLAELECPEVCEASMEMDIWTPGETFLLLRDDVNLSPICLVRVAFHGTVVDIRQTTVEDLVEIGMRRRPHSPLTKEQWTQSAKSFLKSYDRHYLQRIRDQLALPENAVLKAGFPSEASTSTIELPLIQNLTLSEEREERCVADP
ncbi:hypothetical protein NM688_g3866 [Phlebia brevispora]|uniref:Uncharacterized protein n=1 Tax=Phlebia brevispora TaxID=194682 RepID=A0ACC1T4K4_9APHY|nr:hypothetical protein NM688_g3866 [Phlebia brevispora]